MANIYQRDGKYIVTVDGIVIGYGLTRSEAIQRVEEYDFE
tara:strand:- start:641 stop:760 length:120 start_codon:yes stop_codon:yes gene_type:complete